MTKRTTELMALDSIKRATSNPKRHDVRAIMRSMVLNGFGEAPMLDERTGRLIAGHGRLEALVALRLEKKEPPKGVVEKGKDWLVPIQRGWASKNDAEAKAYLVASNRTTELGGWDDSELNEMLSDIAKDGAETLAAAGYDGAELEKMLSDANPAEPDEAPPAPEKSWVKTGDLFQLGEHRLLCGDSTKREDVVRVMGGGLAMVMVTDPPYGVNLDQSWRDKALGDKAMGPGNRNVVQNDDRADWSEVWKLFSGDVAYVWHAGKFSDVVMSSLRVAGFEVCQQIIWNKSVMVMGRSDYHFKHEPCWYAVRKGKAHGWTGDRTQTTVIEAKSPNHIMSGSDEEKTAHPTQKPVECMSYVLKNHAGDVYDPFLGSGTTLIAAEQLRRKCYAIEMSPAYVQIAVERWEKFTGKKHVKL